jgi:hypothetical protein
MVKAEQLEAGILALDESSTSAVGGSQQRLSA